MTDAARPWPKVSPLNRWGPIVLVLAVLVGAGTVATVKAGRNATTPHKEVTQKGAQAYGVYA